MDKIRGYDNMKFWEKLLSIDRRIIYLVIAITVILPLFVPTGWPINVTYEVKNIYDYVENLGPDGVVLLSADYDASTLAELQPMFDTSLRHCFSRDVKVMVMSLYPQGVGLAEMSLKRIAKEYNKVNGVDYCFLGYRPGASIIIMGMGSNIRIPFPSDYYGTPLKDIPMMKGINNFSDIDLVISFSGTGIVASWLYYAHEPYNQDIAWGVTAVMASDYYPFLQSHQIVGLIGGMKGAAEYETLISKPGLATSGMDAQSWAHIMIIIFIIIGNIGYLAMRKK